jgi:hypothetical protein
MAATVARAMWAYWGARWPRRLIPYTATRIGRADPRHRHRLVGRHTGDSDTLRLALHPGPDPVDKSNTFMAGNEGERRLDGPLPMGDVNSVWQRPDVSILTST